MGHIIQISSLKTHGHEELQLSSITATELQRAQITETQIDRRASTRFWTQAAHKRLPARHDNLKPNQFWKWLISEKQS